MLPDHVKAALGIADQFTPDQQRAKIEQIESGFLDIFHSDESKVTLANFVEQDGFGRKVASFVLPGFETNWYVQQIIFAEGDYVDAVFVPNTPQSAPPEIAEKALLFAWLNEPSVVSTDSDPMAIRGGMGYLIFSTANPPSIYVDFAGRASGFAANDDIMHPAGLRRISRFAITSGSPVFESADLMGRVFKASVRSQGLKWKFVETYRLFETSYLLNVLNEIKRRFLFDPDGSLKAAQKSVESELNSFVDLVTNSGLLPIFQTFHDEVEKLCTSGNYFANAVKRSTELCFKEVCGKGAAPKGVAFAYKFRCSIVHAGSKDVVFESFADANLALKDLVPILEDAALGLLKISAC